MLNADADKEIRAIEKRFVQNANAKDPTKLVRDFYADDAVLIPPGSPENVHGTQALVDFWVDLIVNGKAEQVTMDTVSVQASGDLAYEIGRFGYSSPNKQGVLARTTGKYVVVYRKHGSGGYKAIVDIFNQND